MPNSDQLFLLWEGMAAPLRPVFLALLALAVGLLLLWLSARREARRLTAAQDGLRREADGLGRQLAQTSERLAAREDRLANVLSEQQETLSRLSAAEEAKAKAMAAAERRHEAVERLSEQLEDLRSELETARHLAETRQAIIAEHEAELAALRADTAEKLASARREVEVMKELREEMSLRFRELADDSLRRSGQDLEKAHAERLASLLNPFKEHVNRFEEELRQVHGAADRDRARLSEQIKMLSEKTETIGLEALNLTRALKGDRQRQGAWGEMILERLLEDSGLQEGTHFVRQKGGTDDEGGRYRPDVVVRMPQGKALVIDAKVSLTAYEAASSAETEEERLRHLKDHVISLRRHIDGLSQRGYQQLTEGSVDYVLMFIPIEGALSEAWRVFEDLSSYATQRRVGLVTPTTLMLALRTVDHIWTVERRERNAEEIARRAGALYDKFAGFIEDMERVGKALDQAVRARSDAMSKLANGHANLVRQAEMLRELGARTRKQIQLSSESLALDEPRVETSETAPEVGYLGKVQPIPAE